MPYRHCIKPSTASGSTRSGAKLSTPQPQVFFQGTACLGGERATAHPGSVGLHYPVNLVNLLGRDTCPWGRTPCRSVRRGNKRIRAKVHVQQATLCTLKEDAFGAFYRRVHVFYRITHVRFQPLCIGYVLLVYLLPGWRCRIIQPLMYSFLLFHFSLYLLFEFFLVINLYPLYTTPCNLI